MTDQEIITRISSAQTAHELFPDLNNWKKEYRTLARVHPDTCQHPKANEAFQKLQKFKIELDRGLTHHDDAGVITYSLFTIIITGDASLLKKSYENYKKLMALSDQSSVHFKKYIPTSGRFLSENELEFKIDYRAVPICSLGTQPHMHVNWITSRMLEFAAWLNQNGYSHAGFNPESLYVIPENHGLMCVSFYHLTRTGDKLTTISGKYQHFYPTDLKTTKKATAAIDIELAKRTAIYLLGDQSGTGNKLKKTHNEDVLNFLQKSHDNSYEAYDQYREMLRKNFDTKQFNKLII